MNYKKIDWAVICTVIWIIFWLALLMKGFDRVEGFGGLGAFLSGIFAPLALLWFYKSYRIQSNELKLQREELTLQRKALEQSVLAQEGSEIALKEQSKALQAQLNITGEQFEHYKNELNAKKPSFILVDAIHIRNTNFYSGDSYGVDIKKPASRDVSDQHIIESVSMNLTIKNVAGDCTLKDIEPILSTDIANYLNILVKADTDKDFCKIVFLVIPINNLKIKSMEFESAYQQLIKGLSFNIFYSYSGSSAYDKYQIIVSNGKYQFSKVKFSKL